MNRRTFAALASFGFALPRLIGSARADQLDATEAAGGKVGSAASSGLSVDEIVSRVEAFYEKATSFKASFTQRQPHDDWRRRNAGSVIFQRPGKMSWRYTGSGNRIVSDGTRVRVYERENKQLYEQDVVASQYPVALSFLIAQGKLRQTFHFTMRDPKQVGGEGRHVLVAEPLLPSPAFSGLVFFVDAQRYEVARVLIVDSQGNRNRFDFTAGKVNLQVPRGEFALSPPPGTLIIQVPSASRTRP